MRFFIKKLDYPKDCIRVAKVALDNGYYITPTEAQVLWGEYSDSRCAGWIMMPNDDEEIWQNIRYYLEQC